MVKRTKLEVIKDILEVLSKGRNVKITHLIYKSNLSNNSIKPHLNELLSNGLMTIYEEDNKKHFRITQKGQEFLKEYNKMKIFSDSYGLS